MRWAALGVTQRNDLDDTKFLNLTYDLTTNSSPLETSSLERSGSLFTCISRRTTTDAIEGFFGSRQIHLFGGLLDSSDSIHLGSAFTQSKLRFRFRPNFLHRIAARRRLYHLRSK